MAQSIQNVTICGRAHSPRAFVSLLWKSFKYPTVGQGVHTCSYKKPLGDLGGLKNRVRDDTKIAFSSK